jgi:hypothetical protein
VEWLKVKALSSSLITAKKEQKINKGMFQIVPLLPRRALQALI